MFIFRGVSFRKFTLQEIIRLILIEIKPCQNYSNPIKHLEFRYTDSQCELEVKINPQHYCNAFNIKQKTSYQN